MPLETATYISDLVSTNPAVADPTGQGDDHLRLIKSTLLATFPNINGAVNITDEQLNTLTTALAAKQSMVPTGAIMAFGNTFSDPSWLRCNGGTFLYTDEPALGAFLGYSSGTCTLPNLEDTGRFLRSISGSTAVRDTQSNQNKSHTHTGTSSVSVSGTVAGTTASGGGSHSHSFSGTTDDESNSHTHSQIASASTGSYSGGGSNGPLGSGSQTGPNSTGHTHTYSGTTASTSISHTHTFSVSASLSGSGSFTTDADGAAEARPEAYVVVYYIHV